MGLGILFEDKNIYLCFRIQTKVLKIVCVTIDYKIGSVLGVDKVLGTGQLIWLVRGQEILRGSDGEQRWDFKVNI